MTTINPTQSAGSALSSTTGKSISNLGASDFITLMATQLKYQDPTKPQDSTAFIAQLAQFSSVSGIQEMNTSIASLLDEMRGSMAVNATSLVGHDVLVGADTATLNSGDSLSGIVATPTGTSDLTVVINDSAGQIVRQFTVPATTGNTKFTWDGLDDSGAKAAGGNYTVKAIANVYGKSQSVATALNAKVGSVTINSSDNSLVLNTDSLGSIQMSDILQVN